MAAMVTTLVRQSSNANSTTYILPVHTALKPALVLQKRTIPTGKKVIAEDHIRVLVATTDAEENILESKVDMAISVRRNIHSDDADIAQALTYLKDIVQSDEFEDRVVAMQLDLKA
jgi:hypothetical protein